MQVLEMFHFFAIARVQQNPTQLNNFSRVFCHVYSVLVACSGNMDDNISLQAGALIRRHCSKLRAGRGSGREGDVGRGSCLVGVAVSMNMRKLR